MPRTDWQTQGERGIEMINMCSIHRPSIAPFLIALIAACLIQLASPVMAQETKPANLASAARLVLEQHCFECHGANPNKISSDLDLLQPTVLTDAERKIVVPGKPDDSELLRRTVTTDDDERMPPTPKPPLTEKDRKTLRDWIASGAPAFAAARVSSTPDSTIAELPARVKEVFRVHCFDCHGGTSAKAGIRILDWELLVTQKRKVIPGKPEASAVYRLVTSRDQAVMPPPGNPRLSDVDIALIRDWITNGATRFPEELAVMPADLIVDNAGTEYVLARILEHIRTLNVEDRKFVRYFSTNHLLTAGVTRAELELQRDALAKAINHLSRERQIVVPQVVDAPLGSVFAVDIRRLGWHKLPLTRVSGNRPSTPSSLTIFDLALLEYPYAIIDKESNTYAKLLEEYLRPGAFIRPIPYLRSDWFVSTVTQPPLYEDFLQLPFDVVTLENQLGVDTTGNLQAGLAKRAGMTVSGVSRNNRVVERHDAPIGAYWKSIDTATSKGRQNMFLDPLNIEAAGGEIIFNLPNGLQGYFLAQANGRRVSEAPTNIVTDKFAEDKIVRNGLACIRCHDQGMKDFVDNVRPAVEKLPASPGFNKVDVLTLYPKQSDMDQLLEADRALFLSAMAKVLGQPQKREPLIPVSHRYLDEPLSLGIVAGELGLNRTNELSVLFRAPQLVRLGLASLGVTGGVARRDMWEDSFHQVVQDLGIGIPVVPLDGLTRADFPPANPSVDVQMTTNRPGNTFAPGDELVITVSNNSSAAIYIELVGTSEKGEKVVLAPATTVMKPGGKFRFPETGGISVRGGVGKEQITLFACDQPFPPGEVLRGQGTTDRFVHRFFQLSLERGQPRLEFDATRMVKRTIEIETK